MGGQLFCRTSGGRTSTPLRKDKTKQKENKKKKRRVLLESKDFPEVKGLRRGKGTQHLGRMPQRHPRLRVGDKDGEERGCACGGVCLCACVCVCVRGGQLLGAPRSRVSS